jgi:hypothetical protein
VQTTTICAPCGAFPGQQGRSKLNQVTSADDEVAPCELVPTRDPRPGLRRASTGFRSPKPPPPRRPTFAECVESGYPKSCWTPGHKGYIGEAFERRPSFQEQYWANERRKVALERDRKREEQRRPSRPIDISRPSSPSPGVSAIFSLKRTDSGSSFTSIGSSQSAASSTPSTSSSKRSRLNHVELADEDDRDLEGHEAREEQQSREPHAGTNSKSNLTPHGGQAQRRLFGKHKSKGPV